MNQQVPLSCLCLLPVPAMPTWVNRRIPTGLTLWESLWWSFPKLWIIAWIVSWKWKTKHPPGFERIQMGWWKFLQVSMTYLLIKQLALTCLWLMGILNKQRAQWFSHLLLHLCYANLCGNECNHFESENPLRRPDLSGRHTHTHKCLEVPGS